MDNSLDKYITHVEGENRVPQEVIKNFVSKPTSSPFPMKQSI